METELQEIAERYGVSYSLIGALGLALQRGNGEKANFDHPDIGPGRWVPGKVVLLNSTDAQLEATIHRICVDLLQVMIDAPTDPTGDFGKQDKDETHPSRPAWLWARAGKKR